MRSCTSAGHRYWSCRSALPREVRRWLVCNTAAWIASAFPSPGGKVARSDEGGRDGGNASRCWASRVSSDGPVDVAPHGVAFLLGTRGR